ncbi:NAD-dependent epimerase/dehydratase family protein [Streptomyces tauricus]|uniref:NAD-dependent epimerase/dehydratase family protein n=1 Tax=Streptomyces tauricus TaxID=68274 RepID=UPI0022434B44|nr:NAD(P)-dependent oxidoreductase [Streptomyces tauricus]MCW8096303.1 NAD(P)-dependent oxidoreductase [Streptomyces tauricus]
MIGGTGSLGRHICAALLRGGEFHVTAVARHEAPVAPGARLLRADLLAEPEETDATGETDEASDGDSDGGGCRALRRLLADSDIVVNAAGDSWRGTQDRMVASHTVLVERLLRLVPARARLVHLGSVHEYGEIPPPEAADEHCPERPTTLHGRTKLIGSRAVLAATAGGRTDGVVLRVTNVCGPGAPAASFLGSLAERLRRLPPGAPLNLTLAPGMRDFVDARDVADAVVLAATAPVTGLVINVGRGAGHTVPAAAELMIGAAGFPRHRVRMHVATQPENKAGSTGSTGSSGAWTKVDVGRARALLGWSHTRSLQDSVRDQWEATGAQEPSRA